MINIFLAVYAVLLLVGGYMGFKKAGSKMSLYMGVFSSACVALGLYLAQTQKSGYCLVATIAALLTAVFVVRVIKTRKFMPAGMLSILSVVALLVTLFGKLLG